MLFHRITHEYEEIIVFALKEIVRADPCLVRLCVTALEELIYNDYIKLCSENFFRFIYPLGCDDLTIFMKEILLNRFVASNHNDIAKYYVQTIVYIHMYSKVNKNKHFKLSFIYIRFLFFSFLIIQFQHSLMKI